MSPRCFVAADVDHVVSQGLSEARSAFLRIDPGWSREKWVRPENLHLTLAFLGDQPPSAIARVVRGVEGALTGRSRFDLKPAALEVSPAPDRARLLWMRLDDPGDACAALARAIRTGILESAGLTVQDRFTPHVTLCRARRGRPVADGALAAAEDALHIRVDLMSVRSVTLIASRLTSSGPQYTSLKVWCLEGGGPPDATV
jgi:2'-5' RNA ligase